MAQDYSADEYRAMTAFAASPLPNSHFTAAHSAPSNAIPGDEAAVRTSQAAAFPLLMAALPGIGQFALPKEPDTKLAKPELSVSDASPTRRARTIDRPTPQPPVRAPKAPNPSTPAHHAPAARTLTEPACGLRAANRLTTPISAMFHALDAASPSPDAPVDMKPGLQDIFSRL